MGERHGVWGTSVLAATVATVAVVAMVLALAWASPAWASFPGENGRIAFARDGGIYTMNPNGTDVTQITNDGSDPAFSPDGSRIAFVSRDFGDPEVYVMNADGTDQRRLTDSPGFDGQPAFSPDGSRIAFVSVRGLHRDLDREIWVMDADGSNLAQFTDDTGSASERPAFSPDGSRIVFESGPIGVYPDIYVKNVDGTNQENLTDGWNENGADPAFSPRGDRIAFVGARDGGGNQEIYVMNDDGSNQTRLTNTPGDAADFTTWDLSPVFSPNGNHIAFSSGRDGNNDGPFGWDGNFEIYTMDADDGDNQVNRTNNGAFDGAPSWQPLNPDLSVLSSDRPDPVKVGQDLTYSFAVANNGATPANGVVLASRLPSDVTFVSASPGCGFTASTGPDSIGTVRCDDLGNLPRGESTTVTVVVRTTTAGPITNTAAVQSSARDADALDNTDRETTRVNQNRAPTADPDSYATDEDDPLVVQAPGVLFGDADPDGDPLSASLASGPAHGALSLDPDGSFRYSPDADFNGQDSFTYTASDGDGGNATATVEISVAPVAEAPLPEPPNAAPTIANLSPAPGSRTRDRTPAIRATVGDSGTDIARGDIRLWVDGRRVEGFSYDRRSDRLTFVPKRRMEPGRHTVLVVARDGQGLSKSRFWAFRVMGR